LLSAPALQFGPAEDAMDRPIDTQVVRRRWHRRITVGALGLGGIVAVATLGPGMLRPSLVRDHLRTARVEQGPIDATVTASGTVVPEVEQVISSPVDARVLHIRKRAGDLLAKGDVIVELDLSSAQLAVQKLEQDLAIKQNQQAKTRLDLEAQLQDLEGQRKVKKLELGAQQARTSRDTDLFGNGFLSRDELSQSQLTAARVAVELEKIEAEISHVQASNRTQVAGLALERATVQRDRDEARRVLELATTKADRKAALTWTVTEEGAAVKKGDVLARLADLSSFRVEATLSDVHAQRLRLGQPVQIQINEASREEDRLPGTIASIQPAIHDGAVTFSVALARRDSPLLRANLRVDVLVVTDRKPHALRVPRGPFADGEGKREVFVVRGGRAVRTPALLGLSSADYFEVVQGLQAGDEVVISDMSQHLHQRELALR
jgi:HlyD family secretion protein